MFAFSEGVRYACPLCRIDLHAPPYLTHYCVVRADLPIGVQAAQLIHAAGRSSPGRLPDGTYAVALSCANEDALRELACALQASNVPAELIVEDDQPYHGQAMALGVAPADRRRLKRLLSRYPLVK